MQVFGPIKLSKERLHGKLYEMTPSEARRFLGSHLTLSVEDLPDSDLDSDPVV